MGERNNDILPQHADHPGWDADGCQLRMTVTPRNGGVVGHGFACDWTGGHCLPSAACETYRKAALLQPESPTP